MSGVSVIGLGYVGLVNAMFLAKRGLRVYGVDRSIDVVEELRRGETRLAEEGASESLRDTIESGRLTFHATDELGEIHPDVWIVCVPTPCAPTGVPDLAAIDAVAELLADAAPPQGLVILRSTVPPGTTSGRFLPTIRRRAGAASDALRVAFCPERMAEGVPLTAAGLDALFERAPLLVGGVDAASAQAAAAFWNGVGVPTLAMSSCEAAEMAKLLCNEWIDLNIALANEIGLLCERLDLDALEVIAAANTLPKGASTVNVMWPGPGVGGSCLTKDPWLMTHVATERGVKLTLPAAARAANDRMPEHIIRLAEEELASAGKDLSRARVAVLGLAFKEKTADLRATPAEPIVRGLIERGATVRLHDSWVAEKRETYLDLPICRDLGEVLDGADCVVVIAGHPEYAKVDPEFLAGALASPGIVIDGRRTWPAESVRRAGLRYRAVGLGSD